MTDPELRLSVYISTVEFICPECGTQNSCAINKEAVLSIGDTFTLELECPNCSANFQYGTTSDLVLNRMADGLLS